MKRIYSERLRKLLSNYLLPTFQEFVYIVILTSFFIFLSFIAHMRIELNRAMGAGFVNVYYGFPMEWFKITANEGSWYSSLTRTYILWSGLAIDLLLFGVLSLALVRVVDKITDHIPPKLVQALKT